MPIAEPPAGTPVGYRVATGRQVQVTWRRRGLAGLQLVMLSLALGVAVALTIALVGLVVALVLSTALN